MAIRTETGPRAEPERDELAAAYVEAWNRGAPEVIASYFTADAVYDDRGAGALARGREGIRAHAASVLRAFPDLRFELVRSAHGEGFSAAEWRCEMTHLGELDGLPPTGRRLESAGVDVATLDAESRISHLVSYYDGAEIMRGLGLLPARGSRAERLLARLGGTISRRRVPRGRRARTHCSGSAEQPRVG